MAKYYLDKGVSGFDLIRQKPRAKKGLGTIVDRTKTKKAIFNRFQEKTGKYPRRKDLLFNLNKSTKKMRLK